MPGRRHHTVPQFYLRNFADEADQVILVDRSDPAKSHRSAVRKALTESGFYRIETEDLEREEDRAEHDPEGIESQLAILESEWAAAVRAVLSGPGSALTQEHWYRLVQFVAVQSVRGWRWRNDVTALLTRHARVHTGNVDDAVIEGWLRGRSEPHGPADVAAFRVSVDAHFPRVSPPQAVMVQESLRMALGSREDGDLGLAELLASKAMSMIVTGSQAVLTSDEPVCWWAPGPDPVGLATASVVWLPLSRRSILQFSDRSGDLSGELPDLKAPEGPDRIAQIVNRKVAEQAERWIIHHPADSPLDGRPLPPPTEWADELVGIEENDGYRREIYRHRRMPGQRE